jgi:hypothetical protein
LGVVVDTRKELIKIIEKKLLEVERRVVELLRRGRKLE